MKKINILVAGTFHFPMLAENLIELGYDVKIYTSTPRFKFKGKKYYSNIVFIPMLFQLYRKISKRFISSWMKEFDSFIFDLIASYVMRDCDILYGFAGKCFISANKQKKKNKIFILDRACPHIIFQNDMLIEESNKFNIKFKSLSKRLINKHLMEYLLSDYIVVPSNYTAKTFKDDILRKKLRIISLDAKLTKKPNNVIKKEINKKFIVGIVGGGLLRKGYYYLIKAWNELNLQNAELLIKNNKKELFQIKELKDILIRNKSINFHGYVDEINDFYQKCDVFCIPSIDDGFGMVVPEALANSLPVITTSNVGASELIKDGFNGFVVNPRSISDLKNKILFFYNNRNSINKFRKNAFNSFNSIQSNLNYKFQLQDFFKNLSSNRLNYDL